MPRGNPTRPDFRHGRASVKPCSAETNSSTSS